jgi:hypothetical protein
MKKETYNTDCSNCQVKPICGYGDVKCPQTHHKKAKKLAAEVVVKFCDLNDKGMVVVLPAITKLIENKVKEFNNDK